MMHRQCIPVRLDQYVNHNPRLIFEARLVFKARPLFEEIYGTSSALAIVGKTWQQLWSPYGIGQTIIFLPCGFSFLSSSFFFSSPNLSSRRLDVCHTSTHGTIVQLCRAISSQLRHVMYRQSEKNLLSSNISSRCPHNMVNFGLLAAEIGPVVWGTPANFSGFRVLAALLAARQSSSERQPNFAALKRGRHLCSTGRPSRWALATF